MYLHTCFLAGKFKKKKRVGRGVGSGLGKTSGHGHQFSRSTPRGFEGGQKPLHKLLPKFGFTNHNKREYVTVNLDKLQHFITLGRIVPKQNNFVTIRDLLVSGIITNVSDGIKILANGKEEFKTPIHLEVSMASEEAIKTVEAAGGTITCSYFNPLALRAVTKPYKFFILPRRARPPPKLMPYYLDKSKCGYLSPEIQTRNLKLFGTVTSEELYRAEHTKWMDSQREVWKKQRESLVEKGRKKSKSASV